VLRQQAVKAVREGQSVANVAVTLGMNVTTIFRWLAKFADGGQNALLANPIPGRPPKVSAEEMRWIARAVRDNTPQQFKFEFGLWTLSLLRELINRELGKSLSLAIRTLLGVKPYTDAHTRGLAIDLAQEAAGMVDTRVGIINITIEELVRLGHELPSFGTLDAIAEQAGVCRRRGGFVRTRCSAIDCQPAQMARSTAGK